MSLRYKVPQNVQREDQVLFFITFKQLIILLVTGGISYFVYIQLNKHYFLSQLEVFIVFLPLILGAAFAFLRIKGLSLTKFFLLMIEQAFFRPPRRFWQQNTHTFVSMTQPFVFTEKTEEMEHPAKVVSSEKIRNLAKVLDGEESLAMNN